MYVRQQMRLNIIFIFLKMFNMLFSKSFEKWPMYGDLKVLDELRERQTTCSELECPTRVEMLINYLFIVFYMFVGNILLINLLIAMFA